MNKNVIWLQRELGRRKSSRGLTPKQELLVELDNNLVALLVLKKAVIYHQDKCKEHIKLRKEKLEKYNQIADSIEKINNKIIG